MRELTIDEIDSVSGAGFWGNFWGGFTAALTATGDFLGFDGSFGYQGGGGRGFASPNAFFAPPLLDFSLEPFPELLGTTLPDVGLFSFSMQDMRSQAAEIGLVIGSNANEHLAIFYSDTRGDLHVTALITQNSPISVNWDPTALPPGSTIVGLIHNHPNGIPYPSSAFTNFGANDWDSVNVLKATNYSPWEISSSPFIVQYIATPRGTYEYGIHDEPTNRLEAGIVGELIR